MDRADAGICWWAHLYNDKHNDRLSSISLSFFATGKVEQFSHNKKPLLLFSKFKEWKEQACSLYGSSVKPERVTCAEKSQKSVKILCWEVSITLRIPQQMLFQVSGSRLQFSTVLVQLYWIKSCNPDVKMLCYLSHLPSTVHAVKSVLYLRADLAYAVEQSCESLVLTHALTPIAREKALVPLDCFLLDLLFIEWAGTRQGRWKWNGRSGQCWENQSHAFTACLKGTNERVYLNKQQVQKVLIYYIGEPVD